MVTNGAAWRRLAAQPGVGQRRGLELAGGVDKEVGWQRCTGTPNVEAKPREEFNQSGDQLQLHSMVVNPEIDPVHHKLKRQNEGDRSEWEIRQSTTSTTC
jgi:hypothetical protein